MGRGGDGELVLEGVKVKFATIRFLLEVRAT